MYIFVAYYLFLSNFAISECFKLQISISFIVNIFIPIFRPVSTLPTLEIVCSKVIGSVNGSLTVIFNKKGKT